MPSLEQLTRGLAERRPEPADLLRAAPGKDAEHRALRADAEPARAASRVGRRAPVDQRMARRIASKPDLAEEWLLERQDHREPVTAAANRRARPGRQAQSCGAM